jgi:predicted RecB family nuclease
VQRHQAGVLYSAGDLVGYLECEHLTTLGLVNLVTPLARAKPDAQASLIQDMGFAHEAGYLAKLRAQGLQIVEIEGHDPVETSEATRKAMREGAELIFQGAFLRDNLFGRADFLRRVPGPSDLGGYSYEVADTKLARSAKAKFLVQLCFYSELLAGEQGVEPISMHLALGDGTEQSFRVANFSRYFRQLRWRFLEFVAGHPNETYPARCSHCDLCSWSERCEKQWRDDDHLNQVAGITSVQIERLQGAKVTTLEELAKSSAAVPRVQAETLARLRSQAALQLEKRTTGQDKVELIALDPDGRRGFYRLPEPDDGDVFLDMEGDPFELDGLDYLIGVRTRDGGFKAFWAHDRAEERRSFGELMDFIADRLIHFPKMHIYHYAPYEVTALKRMMSLHGIREAEVDDLLRQGRLVDLYKVVREGLRTSEEGLSLKNIEKLYGFERQGDVVSAGASVVKYHEWRAQSEQKLLDEIQRYNDEDIQSTERCLEWLLSLRPAALPWFTAPRMEDPKPGAGDAVREFEARLADYERRLLGALPEDRSAWTAEHRVRELSFQLLGFHRRADKPAWWAVFNRQDMEEDELVEDRECLGALRATGEPPRAVKRSLAWRFRFPPQETKLRAGDSCWRIDTASSLGKITALDLDTGVVEIKTTQPELPPALSIGPQPTVGSVPLREAIFRFADSLLAGDRRFAAVRSVLNREEPRLRGRSPGQPVLAGQRPLLDEALEAVRSLEGSHVFVQGPPGAGKTFTGSHLIVALLAAGFRVGVSSNSHKAIHNLLAEVEKVAAQKGVDFHGVKKGKKDDPESHFEGARISTVFKNEDVGSARLVAGTAWLFAEPELEGAVDYLFVDEAGQVSLANLVAMGTAAKNLVLLGDQMQLGQPIQGVHPGRSGESSLEYLLDGAPTIAEDRGIFLPTSYRMHEAVCRFISDAVYDGRLEPEAGNQLRQLKLSASAHPALKAAGISFVALEHDGNSQTSPEEAAEVRRIFDSLLAQSYADGKRGTRPPTMDDVMVVAPYNAQVNLLRTKLPAGARVGTIDKFQGQEAAAVIVSMTTSSGEDLPRNIEFLYDKNRLNVAISRAESLAVVVCSPKLLHVRCTTPGEMELVNTLCWVGEWAGNARVLHGRERAVQ